MKLVGFFFNYYIDKSNDIEIRRQLSIKRPRDFFFIYTFDIAIQLFYEGNNALNKIMYF